MSIYASDLMSEARKNPEKYEGKRYKVVRGSSLGFAHEDEECDCIVKDGRICNLRGNYLATFADTQLEEIKPEPKPVPFMEAAKAYSEGETVYCMREKANDKRVYKGRGHINAVAMTDHNGLGVSPEEILNGTWYIEE